MVGRVINHDQLPVEVAEGSDAEVAVTCQFTNHGGSLGDTLDQWLCGG